MEDRRVDLVARDSSVREALEALALAEGLDLWVLGPRELAVSDEQARRSGDGPPFRVGGDIDVPERLRYVPPEYPEELREEGVEGTVVLEAVVTRHGDIDDVKVLRSVHPDLDRAAREAVEQWRYATTFYQDTPIPVLLTVTVQFFLQDGR